MIVAAGHGTRLRPLTALRPKPALPVRGIPVVGWTLALLARHGVREVVINTHPLPERLRAAARAWCPSEMRLHFSHEETLLDTGGGIRRVAGFLRESDPCLVLGGDMLLDADLGALVARHRERGDAVTMLLRADDVRAERFGTIGVDGEGRVRRIAKRFDRGGETRSGVYTWANVISARALDTLPEREVFSHLDGWWMPRLAAGDEEIRAELAGAEVRWEPVGTPSEYLAVNLAPPRVDYLDPERAAAAARYDAERELVIGAGATLGARARLRRAVVWDGERVPDELRAEDGVFAGGRFHAVATA